MLARILLCVGRPALERRLRSLLEEPDVIVETVGGRRSQRWSAAVRRGGDVAVLTRELMPTPAADALRLLRESPESPEVLVLADREDRDDRAHLLAAGAVEVLGTDLPDAVLGEVIRAVVERRRERSAERLRSLRPGGSPRLGDFVSASPAMQAFLAVVRRVVNSDASLLILGETGVGKERLARAIHSEGRRASGPFVAVNCGALPETLLESELFGHEEGAFTGASRSRRGWFELAHRGTLFLDEIGETPLHLQVKLLRVLQEHEFQRIGGETSIRVDVRIMAASNLDLAAEVESGEFRRDLFYRLGVVTLELPALRDRREDVPGLVESYIRFYGDAIGRDVEDIRPEALKALVRYGWPGNVRELMNVVERAVLLCDGTEITLESLPTGIRGGARSGILPALPPAGAADLPPSWLERPLREARRDLLDLFERAYLAGLLRQSGGRIAETARRAGIGPRSLHEKLRRLGLRKEDFKVTPSRPRPGTDGT